MICFLSILSFYTFFFWLSCFYITISTPLNNIRTLLCLFFECGISNICLFLIYHVLPDNVNHQIDNWQQLSTAPDGKISSNFCHGTFQKSSSPLTSKQKFGKSPNHGFDCGARWGPSWLVDVESGDFLSVGGGSGGPLERLFPSSNWEIPIQ